MDAPVPEVILAGRTNSALIGTNEGWVEHEVVVVDAAQPVLLVWLSRAANGLNRISGGNALQVRGRNHVDVFRPAEAILGNPLSADDPVFPAIPDYVDLAIFGSAA